MTTFNRESTGADVVAEYGKHAVVITGASEKGLGAGTALALVTANPPPAHIILLARSASKVQPVIDQIAEINTTVKVNFVSISLDDLESVRSASREISNILGPNGAIDILINNAGIMAVPFSLSKQGYESQFAVNHLGHFVLTHRLLPLIQRAGPSARVINLSSDGYLICPFRPDVIASNYANGADYNPWAGYGQSKTANILFSHGLAARVGIISYAVHPGVIMTTSLADGLDPASFNDISVVTKQNTGDDFVIGPQKTAAQGVATTVLAAIGDVQGPNGSFLSDCQVTAVKDYAKDEALVQKLWEMSEAMAGEKWQ